MRLWQCLTSIHILCPPGCRANPYLLTHAMESSNGPSCIELSPYLLLLCVTYNGLSPQSAPWRDVSLQSALTSSTRRTRPPPSVKSSSRNSRSRRMACKSAQGVVWVGVQPGTAVVARILPRKILIHTGRVRQQHALYEPIATITHNSLKKNPRGLTAASAHDGPRCLSSHSARDASERCGLIRSCFQLHIPKSTGLSDRYISTI
jgi:hypothetical protein